jgi:hypothetical protein
MYLFWSFGIRNLFDPGSGMEKFGSGIRDKHTGSATLVVAKHVLYGTHPTEAELYGVMLQ